MSGVLDGIDGPFNACCYRETCIATKATVSTLRAQLEAAEADIAAMRERMHFLATDGAVEGFVNVESDIYDYACDSAEENGREEPNDDDLTGGLCRLIDAARTKEETK